MTVRDFISFAKGPSGEDAAEKPFVTIRSGRVYIDDFLAVKVNSRLEKRFYAYFRKINRIAARAIEDGEILLLVRLRNKDEAARYESAAGYILKKLRKNT